MNLSDNDMETLLELTPRRSRLTTSSKIRPKKNDESKVVSWDKANLMCSDLARDPQRHHVLLDFDYNHVVLLPSSTSGHFHLVIEAGIPLDKYINIVAAFEEAGLVESGFLEAIQKRGHGGLRPPGVSKHKSENNFAIDENGNIESSQSYQKEISK